MCGYYARKLAGERLRRCYEVAPPRVRRYLEAEIAFVLEHIRETDSVLELGCGYGRVLRRLLDHARLVTGIDTAPESLRLARELLGDEPTCQLHEMDALDLGFPDGAFDVVVCIQNGVCAFEVDQRKLLREALRVTRPDGTVLLSSYAQRFWDDRLDWFRRQADEGLIGPIDEQATGNGVIVCTDGLRLGAVGPDKLAELTRACGAGAHITEVDGSSLFCVIKASRAA
ncbi:MAG: class I SAM-dependent methyltransferase [Planctomycetota bacterium]|jgi:2-polyprenyl-6-hydroxyphenyl methylase/3-demethylubiquinone-9 3-methyltransferase